MSKKAKSIIIIIEALLLTIGMLAYLFFSNKDVSNDYFQENSKNLENPEISGFSLEKIVVPTYSPTHPLEKAAYSQVGVVREYDRTNGYYSEGGNPPTHTGVCSDVITRALLVLNYDIQEKIYQDMKKYPSEYDDIPDKNINHRRVKNLLVFFEKYFVSLSSEVDINNPETFNTWQAGDIVTYEKIPGKLWHVAIISGEKNTKGIPMIIDNHGYGTQVRISITSLQSPISGHFRIPE